MARNFTDDMFDELVRKQLEDTSPELLHDDLPAADWSEMENRLEQSETSYRRLLYAKSIEVVLVVFAIWTAVQFFQTETEIPSKNNPSPTSINTQKPSEHNAIIEADEKVEKAERVEYPSSQSTTNGTTQDANNASRFEDFIEINEPATSGETAAPNNPTNNTGKPVADASTIDNINYQNDASNNLNAPSSNPTPTPIANSYKTLQAQLSNTLQAGSDENTLLKNEQVILDFENTELLSLNLEPLSVAVPAMKALAYSFDALEAPNQSKHIAPKRSVKVGVFASSDWFSIQPADQVAVAKDAVQPSGSIGILVDIPLYKKLTLQTGGAFVQRKQHEYSFAAQSQGTTRKVLEVNTKSIEVPVQLQYEFLRIGDAALYVVGGISNYLNLVIENSLQEVDFYSGVITNSTNSINFADQRQVDNSADQGVLEVMEIEDNHYLSVNCGAGITYEFGKRHRFEAFAQAQYKKGILTIGRHEDKISATAFSAGLKSYM